MFYEQFWELFLDNVRERHPHWTNARATNPGNWFSMPCPFKGGPYYAVSFAQGDRIRSELYLDYTNDRYSTEISVASFPDISSMEDGDTTVIDVTFRFIEDSTLQNEAEDDLRTAPAQATRFECIVTRETMPPPPPP